jgi:hypothetical protein
MTPASRPLREPTVWFLLITVVVHVIRQNLVDVLVFLGVAVLIVVDARRSARDRSVRWWPSWPVAALVCTSYALLLLPMGRSGWPMRVAVAVPGLVALVVVLRCGRGLAEEPAPRPAGRGWVVWTGLLLVGCLAQLFNWLQQPDPNTDSYAHPTLSSLVDPLLAGSVVRAVAAAVWLAVGIWLLGLLARPSKAAS